MKKFNIINILPLVVLFLIFCLYFSTSPVTVQHGDSGELVTNALKLRVNHPSGYPLYNLIFYPWLKFANPSNTFHVASIVNIFISIIGFSVLIFSSPLLYRMAFTALSGLIASSAYYWEYSLIPDVFILNCFFIISFMVIYLNCENTSRAFSTKKIFLALLGFSNHLTLVLSLPVLWPAFKRLTSKKIISLILISVLSVSAVYCFLFFFATKELGSWGNLSSFIDLVKHVLRMDYGTFNLVKEKTDTNYWATIMAFFYHFCKNFWSLIFFMISNFIILKSSKLLKSKIIACAPVLISIFLTSIVFFYLAKISPIGFNNVTLPRFYLMPLLLISILTVATFCLIDFKYKKYLYILLCFNLASNLYFNFSRNNFSQNTVISDFMKNMINQMPKDSILYLSGDSETFVAYYLSNVEKLRPDVILLSNNIYYDWEVKKVLGIYPDIFVPAPAESGIVPRINFSKYSFFTNSLQLRGLEYYAIDYFPTYFRIKPGQGVNFYCETDFRSDDKLTALYYFNYFSILKNSYSSCYFYEGLEYFSKQEYSIALEKNNKALEVSPFNLLALERKCFILNLLKDTAHISCYEKLENLFSKIHPGNYVNEKLLKKE